MGARWQRMSPFLVAAALLVSGGASMIHVSSRSSPVWDEMNFYGLGAYFVDTGRFDIPGAFHPPLSNYLDLLALDAQKIIRLGVFDPIGKDYPAAELLAADVERGNLLLHWLGLEQFHRARLPFILVYCLLGGVVFLWSRRWFGALGGLFSLALYLLCPNLMAHGYVIATDLLVAALLFSALYFLFLAFEVPALGPVLGFLICLALAPTAKLLGLLVGPGAALCVVGRATTARELAVYVPGTGRRPVTRWGFLAYWVGIGMAGVLLTYASLVVVYQGETDLHSFRLTLDLIGEQVKGGHPVFLDGLKSRHGFVGYYAKAIPYKTSLAVLLAWGLSALVRGPRLADGWIHLGLVGLGATLFVSTSQYTIGLRYALVAFPLMFVAAGRLAATGGATPLEARVRLGLCAAVVLVCLGEQASVYPYPRAYVNRAFVTGPKYEALADTDLDWGEGLIALGDFVKDRNLERFALSYHGSASPNIFGIRPAWYENPTIEGVSYMAPPTHGWFFVSSTNLSGLYFPDDRYRWLRGREPDAVVGGTIYGFDLDRLAREGTSTSR